MALNYDDINVGDEIPELSQRSISRTTLALFAGASNDHNPIHIDTDVAKAAGMEDVFAQGMLSMAYLGQALTNFAPQQNIRTYGVRFGSITNLKDKITCTGTVIEKFQKNGENCVKLEVKAQNQDGDVKLSGHAVIAI